jgi:hypothetical protein
VLDDHAKVERAEKILKSVDDPVSRFIFVDALVA